MARGNYLAVVEVLVVEDDPALQATVVETLSEWGLAVAWASNGAEAIQLVKDGLRPRVVLLDLQMPIMDGREFLERCDSDPALADVRVVLLTGSDDDADSPRVVERLMKPTPGEQLLAAIRRHAFPPEPGQRAA